MKCSVAYGVSSDGLTTTVLPAASAGITFMPTETSGPFQVMMIPIDAVRLGDRVRQLAPVGGRRRDACLRSCRPTRRSSGCSRTTERGGEVGDAVGHAVVEDRQPGQLVAVVARAGRPRRTSTSRRCHGVQVRHVSNAVVCGADGIVDVARPGERHRSLHLAGCREHVLVHAASARRAQFARRCAGAPREPIDRPSWSFPLRWCRPAFRRPASELLALDFSAFSWSCQGHVSCKNCSTSPTRWRDHRRRRRHRDRLRRGAVRGGRRRRHRRRRTRRLPTTQPLPSSRRATRRSAPSSTCAQRSRRWPWPTPRSTRSAASTSSSTTPRS